MSIVGVWVSMCLSFVIATCIYMQHVEIGTTSFDV